VLAGTWQAPWGKTGMHSGVVGVVVRPEQPRNGSRHLAKGRLHEMCPLRLTPGQICDLVRSLDARTKQSRRAA